MTRRLILVTGAVLVAACTKDNDRHVAPAAPVAPPAAAPAPAPSAMTNPDDIPHVTFSPQLNIDLASMTRLPNGVYIRDLKQGTGKAASSGDLVSLHYDGRLPTGQRFDHSEAPDPPLQFHIDAQEVVPGFDWAVKGMKAGGQRLAIIPPSLGYGARANGPLPANAILVFTLDLLSVTPYRP